MNAFIGELGKKLAERWLSLLVLPGVLYLAVAAAAHVLGHAHALDPAVLVTSITTVATAHGAALGAQVVLLIAIGTGAAAAGVIAQGLGFAIERLVLAGGWHTWPRPLHRVADRRVGRRRRRWDEAHASYHRLYAEAVEARHRGLPSPDAAPRHIAYRRRTRIALERPERPTWMGDRLHTVVVRLERDLHLDLVTVWPHLWLVLPDLARTEITAARQDLSRAITLSGWAVLYLLMAWWWWPALAVGFSMVLISWRRARAAADAYARLVEAATRLHVTGLALHLGIAHEGPADADLGDTLTLVLHTQPNAPFSSKFSPDMGSPVR